MKQGTELRRFEKTIITHGSDMEPITIGKALIEEEWRISDKWFEEDQLVYQKILDIKIINKKGDFIEVFNKSVIDI